MLESIGSPGVYSQLGIVWAVRQWRLLWFLDLRFVQSGPTLLGFRIQLGSTGFRSMYSQVIFLRNLLRSSCLRATGFKVLVDDAPGEDAMFRVEQLLIWSVVIPGTKGGMSVATRQGARCQHVKGSFPTL